MATKRVWLVYAIPVDVEEEDVDSSCDELIDVSDLLADFSRAEYMGSLVQGKEEGLILEPQRDGSLQYNYQ
jgi:hypothetical protein